MGPTPTLALLESSAWLLARPTLRTIIPMHRPTIPEVHRRRMNANTITGCINTYGRLYHDR
ncbi:hypothetical protein LguiA_014498 [Lonicera macranthoides]